MFVDPPECRDVSLGAEREVPVQADLVEATSVHGIRAVGGREVPVVADFFEAPPVDEQGDRCSPEPRRLDRSKIEDLHEI